MRGRIVLFSTLDEAELSQRAIDAKVDGYIAKGLGMKHLVAEVDKICYVDMIASGIDAAATTSHSVTPTMNGREPTFASAAGDSASPIRNSASTSKRRPNAAVGFA